MHTALAVALLAACGPTRDIEITRVPDFPTLLRVRFDTRTTTTAQVAATVGDTTYTTPMGPVATHHDFVVLGLPSRHEVDLLICAGAVSDGDCKEESARTAAVPGRVVPFEHVGGDTSDGPPFVLTSVISGEEGESSVQILDALGRPTWVVEPTWGFTPTARFSRDGTAVWMLLTSKEHVEDAVIVRQPLIGGDPEEIQAPYAHHDFVELEDGTLAWIAAELREVDGEAIVGDRIVERAPDGTTREVWTAFDWLEVVPNAGWSMEQYPFGVDWTHANGLHYDAGRDAYTLSLYYHRSLAHIDRSSGELLWMLGGEDDDFGGTSFFGPQHAPDFDAEGHLTVFDNGGTGSSAVGLRLDEDAWTAQEVWRFSPDDGRGNLLLGDVAPQPDGGALISWGEHGAITHVDASGELAWELQASQTGVVGQVSWRGDLYRP